MSAPTSTPPQPTAPTPRRHAQNDEMPKPAELKEIAIKSLQTGAVTGVMGTVVGLGSGIMRSAPPALFAVFAGLQWFALGSSFIASRSLLHHAWGGEENLSSTEKVSASAAAGGVSGMIGGLVRGPRNIITGIVFFSALGGGTTFLSQRLPASKPQENKTSMLASKWSPLRSLSDQEYEKMLEEKLLRLDAEISIIDDTIAAVKASAKSQAEPKQAPAQENKSK